MNKFASITKPLMWIMALLLAAFVAGCGGGGGQGQGPVLDSPTLSPIPTTLVSVAITPATASKPVGGTQQFTATATYSDGSTSNVTASSTWTSATTTVATIVPTTGVATGVAIGTSVITATFGGKTAPSATLTVTGVAVASIAVTPLTASVAISGVQQFTATATYSDGTTGVVTTSSTWNSATTAVATVGLNTGAAVGVNSGSSLITASLGGQTSPPATLTVTNVTVSSFVLSPATALIQPTGTQQFTATATYSDGTTGVVTASTAWTSSDTSVATILTTGGATPGLATGVKIGTSTITATVSGLPAQTATLNVTLNLRRAANFAVLAGAITNNAATTVINTGDVGGSSITAAPTISSGAYYTTGAPAYDDAMTDLPFVIADANSTSIFSCDTNTAGGMGTVTMTPGVHCLAGAVTGVVILTLNGPGVYIFRTAGSLSTAAGSSVVFTGGADNTNTSVFWVVGGSNVGSPGTFVGTILSAGALVLGDGDTLLNGRVLTTAAATLTNNIITKPTP